MRLPPETAEIFAHLSRGWFLSLNTPISKHQRWFLAIQQQEADFRQLFALVGFQLEQGNGFFYASRLLGKSALEEQLEKAHKYIQWLNFLTCWQPSVGVGFRFSAQDLLEACAASRSLGKQLGQLSSRQSDSRTEQVKAFLRKLERESLIAEISPQTGEYLVLSAYHFVEELLYRLQVSDR
jgi:hypothetical protein